MVTRSRWIARALTDFVVTLLALSCGCTPAAAPTSDSPFGRLLDTPVRKTAQPLAVPFISQIETNACGTTGMANCVPASLAMVADYYGLRPPALVDDVVYVHLIREEATAQPNQCGQPNVTAAQIEDWLAGKGLAFTRPATLSAALDAVAQGYPCLVGVVGPTLAPAQTPAGWYADDPYHVLVLTGAGVREGVEIVYVNDPLCYAEATGACTEETHPGYYDRAAFEAAMLAHGMAAFAVVGKTDQSGEVLGLAATPSPAAPETPASPAASTPTGGPLVPGIARVSVSSAGAQTNNRSQYPALSGDGRYVAFSSPADNLVRDDTNRSEDVFVHDLVTRQTTRVSESSTGAQANKGSMLPHISADGRYVTFVSYADNLVPGDVNGVSDVFVHDLVTGETTRVSVSTAGVAANDDSSGPFISGNGRYVLFRSDASNLVPDDTNGCGVSGEYTGGHCPDVFVHDRETGTTERVSLDRDGKQVDGESSYDARPSISDDGRYVAYNQFDPVTFTGGRADRVYVRDRQEGTTTLVSVDDSGRPLEGNAFDPTISADGRRVAFVSQGAPVVDGVRVECQSRIQSCVYVYVRDAATGETTLASLDAGGQRLIDGFPYDLRLSADGNSVVFALTGSDGAAAGIYAHTLSTRETVRVTGGRGWQPSVSAHGDYVAFTTDASLVGDDTNGVEDIYVVSLVPAEASPPVALETQVPEPAAGEPSIAYIGADNNLWVIDADGSNARRLTNDADPDARGFRPIGAYGSPTWSSDGARLYFVHLLEGAASILVFNVRGEELATVVSLDRAISSIAVSPDNDMLAYIYDVPAPECELLSSRSCLATLKLTTSASSDQFCTCDRAYSQLAFSPDTSEMVMRVSPYVELGRYRLGGPGPVRLGMAGGCHSPVYSLDGDYVLAICADDPLQESAVWGLYALHPEEEERVLLKQWKPAQRPLGIDMSQDGAHLALELDGMVNILDLATLESRTLVEGRQPAWRPLGSAGSGAAPLGGVAEAPATLRVAILAPLIGAAGAFGQPMRDGALLAIEEWNARGGVNGTPIEPVVEDSKCNAEAAASAANKVIDQDGVRFIIGEVCQSAAIPIAEIAMARSAFLISPAVTPPRVAVADDGTIRSTVFSAGPASAVQGTVAARFAAGQLRARTAAVFVDQDSDYMRAMAEAFTAGLEAAGGRVVVDEVYARNAQDFSAMLIKVKDAEPDVLYLPGYASAVSLIVAQARGLGVIAVLLGSDSWSSPDLDTRLHEGGYFTVDFSAKDPRESVQAFISRYRARYGMEPDALAVLGYDAAQTLFQAMALASTTTDVAAVAQAMASGTFAVVTGELAYDARHSPVRPVTLLGIEGGEVVYVDTLTP